MEDTFLQVLRCSCREALWRIGLVTGTYQWSNQQWPSEKVSYCGSIVARSPSHNDRLKDPLDLCWYHKGCLFASERRQRWRGEGAEGKKRRNSVRVKETMHAWGWGLHGELCPLRMEQCRGLGGFQGSLRQWEWECRCGPNDSWNSSVQVVNAPGSHKPIFHKAVLHMD